MDVNNDFLKEGEKENDFIIDDVSPQTVFEQENVTQVKSTEVTLDDACSPEIISEDETMEPDAAPSPQEEFHEEHVPQDSTSAIIEQVTSLSEFFARLEEKFDKKIAEDAHKNALFDKMYEELAMHKKNLYAKIIGPFINETISLLDDYERLIERIDTIDHDKLVKYFKGIPDDIENILDNNGVERFTDDTEKFNPKTQRAINTIPTCEKEKDGIVAERSRKGYRWNGVMLKPEMVRIYKYKEGFVNPEPGPEVNVGQETNDSEAENQ